MTIEPGGDFILKSSDLEHLEILEVTTISEILLVKDGIFWFELNTVF